MRPATAQLFLIITSMNLFLVGKIDAVEPDVIDKLKGREAQFQKVDITFEWTQRYAAGAISQTLPIPTLNPQAQNNQIQTLLPPQETILNSINRWCWDGDFSRMEFNHSLFDISAKKFANSHSYIVSGPKGIKSLHPQGVDGASQMGAGYIHPQIWEGFMKNVEFYPIIFHYRPVCPTWSLFELDRYKPTGASLTIASRPAKEYQRQLKESTTSLWLDAEDATLLRVIRLRNGRMTSQTDAKYSLTEQGLKVLSEVRHQSFSTTGQVLEDSLLKFTTTFPKFFSPDEFNIVFPKGTSIFDQRTNTSYLVDSKMRLQPVDYLLNPIGSPISQDHVIEISEKTSRWYLIGGIFFILAIVICVGVLLWRRKKMKGEV